ncbi:hypothetical protein KBC89_00200 [Candidatus Woesebacteria bacterium]|nr:hypothetical protein [Candidatus Woesebacteria bacterium]
MDNFLEQLKKNITSSFANTKQTVGDIFGKAQTSLANLVRGGQQKADEVIAPLQYDIAIPGPTSGSYKPFKNLYLETAAQALGVGARDTDVLERLPSATFGALKGAGNGLGEALSFGWWKPEIKYADDIEKQAGDMTEIEFNVLGTIGTFLVGGELVQGALRGVPLLARVATVAPRTFNVLSTGLTFAGLTQIQKDEAQKNAAQRAKDFVGDFALGGAFSIAGMKTSFLKSSAVIGPATYVTSLLKGESNGDALKDTAAMMGLHSLNFAVAKFLPNGSEIENRIEKAASEQLKISKAEAMEYLGISDKATAEEMKQAWKNKVVDITKRFPAQAKQTPQEMGVFNQAWNTANRAYEFLAKVSNPEGYTGKSFAQEFQDLYYQLWKDVPDKRSAIVKAVRSLPAGLSVRATLNDGQRNEIVSALGGETAQTRLGKVAELTDADLVSVAMENKISVTPSKITAPAETIQLPATEQTAEASAQLKTNLSLQEQKAVKAAEIRDKYVTPEEKELADAEKIPSIGDILQSQTFQDRLQGKVTAPTSPRADQLREPPPGKPPRPPQEVSLDGAPPSPEGSALDEIDKMVGKISTAKSILGNIKNAIETFPRMFTDRFAPIKQFEDQITKLQGQPINIDSSPYVAARMYAGRFGIVEGNFKDLYNILQPVRKLRADFTRFVLSERAIERAERGFDNPNGVTQQTAEQALVELKDKVGDKAFKAFEQVGQGIQNWSIKSILQPMKDAGILGKEAFTSIVENNKRWMPFHVLEYMPSMEQADQMAVGSETFSVSKQGVVKSLEGTEKIIRDPFMSIIDNLTKAVSLVERNKVAQKLIELRNSHPDAAKEFIKFLPDGLRPPPEWEAISVFIDGKVTKWAVPKDLSEAMHALSPAETGLMGKMILASSKAFKAGTTSLYFPFTLSNAIRDYQTASIVSKWGFNPANWLSGFKDGLKAAFKFDSKAYDEFMTNKGGYGGYIESSKGLAVASEQLFTPEWMNRAKIVVNPFQLISTFSEAIELAPRLGVYKKGIAQGATPLEAAYEARNVTVDFAKAGIEGRLINMWIPFVNARWQGLLTIGRVMKENPFRTTARALALTVLPGVATYFYNVMTHEDLWDDIPQWAKDTYFIVIVGEGQDSQGNRVPKVVQIPKGDMGTIFFNPLMYALEYVRKQEPTNLFKLGLEWMSQLSPVAFTRDGELSAQSFLGSALPPALKVPLELATNTNLFTGFPIVPQRLEKVTPTEQYDEKTPQIAVKVGQALGISPMKLTHAISGLAGSFSRQVMNPADIINLTTQRFYRLQGGQKQQAAWDIKYEAEVGYNTTRLQMKRLIEQGQLQQAQQMALKWNQEAEKLIPQVVPLLMKDDPKEAASFQSSITFDAADLQRLLKTTLPGGVPQNAGTDQTLIPLQPGLNTNSTMGQLFQGGQQNSGDTIRRLIYK